MRVNWKAKCAKLERDKQRLLEELFQLALKERRHREPDFRPSAGPPCNGGWPDSNNRKSYLGHE